MSDNSFSISTSQNVSIDYEVAGIGERILAQIIDWLIQFGYFFLVYAVGYALIQSDARTLGVVIIIVLFFPFFLYSLLFETFMQGQTPGKKFRKIKVVKIDGQQASFGGYLLRWLFSFLDIYFFYALIGILCVVINKKGQRLGDIIAGTTVIKVSDTTSLRDTIYEKLKVDHQVTYQEVRKLSSEEVQLIKKVLNTQEYRENYDMVYSLTNKIQAKMNVTRMESFPEDFLKTVVKDYNSLVDE
jgi:uncharacterized RDD family membrane protein YckC